jgi:hypothetical protein
MRMVEISTQNEHRPQDQLKCFTRGNDDQPHNHELGGYDDFRVTSRPASKHF